MYGVLTVTLKMEPMRSWYDPPNYRNPGGGC